MGILGVAVFSMAMFLNTNKIDDSAGSMDLAILVNINSVNAEDTCCIGDKFKITSILGGWHCQNDTGTSCCPFC